MGSTKFWVKKCGSKKFQVQIFFWSIQIFGPKKYWNQKIVSKSNVGQKNVGSKNELGPKKMLGPKNVGSKTILVNNNGYVSRLDFYYAPLW